MDIDLSILRMLEREKEISFEVLVEAIEQALLTAYHKTPGAQEQARVELDRKTGHVTVLATEVDDDGTAGREYDDTPDGLRPDRRHDREADHAAAAARRRGRHPVRRVLRQGGRHRLRGHPAGPQPRRRDGRPRQARGDAAGRGAGAGRELRPRRPGSSAWSISVRKGMRGPQITLSRSHPNLVQKLFALEVPEIADGTVEIAGDRPRGRPPHQDRGPLDRARASTPRAPASARWASGCAT